jgi:predicted DCC family thiol-disulfide oxidoreductase YuxK
MRNEMRPDGDAPKEPAVDSSFKRPHSSFPPGPVVLYDGDCGMCHRAVAFTLRHERGPTLGFSSLGSPYAVAALAERGCTAPPPNTMVVIDGPDIRIRSDAALLIANHLRAPWRWLRILRWIPKKFRDAAYAFVATRRQRWFKKPDSACPVPDAATRRRFL